MKKRNRKHQRGASLVEAIILVGLVAIVAMTAFLKFGKAVEDKSEEQAQAVESLQGDANAPPRAYFAPPQRAYPFYPPIIRPIYIPPRVYR